MCFLAFAHDVPTVAEHAQIDVDALVLVVVDQFPELEVVVVVGQCDGATTLQASTRPCSEAFKKGWEV